MIQYFNNTDCTSLIGTSDLQPYADTCMPVDGSSDQAYMKVQCTTNNKPVVPNGGVLVE